MSLRHAVLGLLIAQPATGYELAQRFDRSLSNAWHASHSQIYPELARLEKAGMVEVVGTGARRSRTFAVTPIGLEELRRWMTESEPNRSQRSETTVRWFLLELLPSADQRIVLERELAFCTGEIERLQTVADVVDATPGPNPFRSTLDLGLRINVVVRDWLTEQIAALGDG